MSRLMGELVVIVLGVLIALGGQSWWENRAASEDRARALRLLHEDVSRLEQELRFPANADSVAKAIDDILDGTFGPTEPALAEQLRAALWSFGFEIGAREGEDLLPAYADLKNSGRLALLPDTVRSRMPMVELQLSILSRFLDDLVFHHQNRIDPILYQSFDLTRPTVEGSGDFGLLNPRRHLVVFEQREVRNVMVLKSALLRDQLERSRATADSLVVLRDLIESVREDG